LLPTSRIQACPGSGFTNQYYSWHKDLAFLLKSTILSRGRRFSSMRPIRCLLLLLVFLAPVLRADLGLTYTVTGHGGLSDPVPGVSDHPFWWIDTEGDASVTGMDDVYFTGSDPSFPWPPISQFSGSSLLSSSFAVSNGESLDLSLTLAGSSGASYFHDLGFVVLLNDRLLPVALLYMGVPDGDPFLGEGEYGRLSQSSPGVDLNYSVSGPLNATIGGTYYSDPVLGCIWGRCTVDISSSITLRAGTYELLFSVGNERYSNISGATLIANSVNVAEPETLILLILMLAGLYIPARRALDR
jgi:hypothetical protein